MGKPTTTTTTTTTTTKSKSKSSSNNKKDNKNVKNTNNNNSNSKRLLDVYHHHQTSSSMLSLPLSSISVSASDSSSSSSCCNPWLFHRKRTLNHHPKTTTTTTTRINESSLSSSVSTTSTCTTASTNTSNSNSTTNATNPSFDVVKELNELSVAERERVLEDIHGVVNQDMERTEESSPEFLKRCFQEFHNALQGRPQSPNNTITNNTIIPIRKRKAYQRAIFLQPSLEQDVKFQLKFLRANHYQGYQAAVCLCRYYEQKWLLFGNTNNTNANNSNNNTNNINNNNNNDNTLVKRITIQDLSPLELQNFQKGFLVQLPGTDQMGRPVFYFDMDKFDSIQMTVENVLRCFWYQMENAIYNNDIAQKRGICVIMLCSKNNQSQTQQTQNHRQDSFLFSTGAAGIAKTSELAMRSGTMLNECLPVNITSYHICYDDPTMEFWIQTIRRTVGRYTRLRIRTHFGSIIENEYSLMSFGIRCNNILQKAKAGDMSRHEEYIQECIQGDLQKDEMERQEFAKLLKEYNNNNNNNTQKSNAKNDNDNNNNTSSTITKIVPYPNSQDVLIGRGLPYREYIGNQLWMKDYICCTTNLNRYISCKSRFEKTCLTMDIFNSIQQSNIRYLERIPNIGWKEMDPISAREKTAIALRSRIANSSANANANATMDSKIQMSTTTKSPSISSTSSLSSTYMNNDDNKNNMATTSFGSISSNHGGVGGGGSTIGKDDGSTSKRPRVDDSFYLTYNHNQL